MSETNRSISSIEESPRLLVYVVSVFSFIASLFLTGLGYLNNSWEVLKRKDFNDEFQRGIRGSDCYNFNFENKCIPWIEPNKSSKFPEPFSHVLPPSFIVNYMLFYLGSSIIFLQMSWLLYSIAHCCSSKFAEKMDRLKIAMFHVGILTGILWFVLFALLLIETNNNQLLDEQYFKPEYEISIGFGFYQYLIGLFFYLAAIACLFNEQIKVMITKLNKNRQAVPTSEELVPRNT